MRRRVRTFSYFGLGLSFALLAISLAGAWLLTDESIVVALAVGTISLQVILNDLYWRTQKSLAQGGETLLYCQLSGADLHIWREPMLTVQSSVSNGMLALIWASLISCAILLAIRNGISQIYLTIFWRFASVLSGSWLGWIIVGRRCLNDDEILITESACLAGGRLDRWDLPDWHLLNAEFRTQSGTPGGTLFLRIWREGPYQQLIERLIPLPGEVAAQAGEACEALQSFIKRPVEGIRIRRISSNREKTAKRREQLHLERVTTPVRVSQIGDLILLLFTGSLCFFSLWIPARPEFSHPLTGHSFADWHLLPVSLAVGGLTLADATLNILRNKRFRAGLDEDPLLLFRLPSLWLECHQPEILQAARRELINDGLLLLVGTLFTGLAFNLHRPATFRYFMGEEIGLLLSLLLLVFLIFIVYRDWAMRRRLGLVLLSRRGLWLFDRQHRWDLPGTRLVSCSLEPSPSRSFEAARLMLQIQRENEEELTLMVPLDKAAAAQMQETLAAGPLYSGE